MSKAWQAWQGSVRSRKVRCGMAGEARFGKAGFGVAWFGRRGWARRGEVWNGLAGKEINGTDVG